MTSVLKITCSLLAPTATCKLQHTFRISRLRLRCISCWPRFLSEPTLEMLQEMRGQLARMLADAGLVDRSAAAPAGNGRPDGWDEPSAPWNRCAARPAVVRLCCQPGASHAAKTQQHRLGWAELKGSSKPAMKHPGQAAFRPSTPDRPRPVVRPEQCCMAPLRR